MLKRLKDWSLVPRGIRHKFLVGFSLMSVIPLLVIGFILINYVFPTVPTIWDISLIVGITVFIAVLGYVVVRQIVEPIIRLSLDAREIARGEFKPVEIASEDEVGELAKSLNLMTQRIRDNMEELRLFSQKTQEINVSISKKVLTLSGLLQIGNLISQSAPLEEIVDGIVQKLAQVVGQQKILLVLELDWLSPSVIWRGHQLSPTLEELPVVGLLGVFRTKESSRDLSPVLIEATKGQTHKGLAAWCETNGLSNAWLVPIPVRARVRGVLVIGGPDPQRPCGEEDLDIIKLFVKQLSIATENDYLMRRSKELEIRDELTGLYNVKYIHQRLGEEIQRAMKFQRPCSFLLIALDDLAGYRETVGDVEAERALKKLAKLLETHATEVDRIGRLRGDTFAMVLPERNKREACELGETVRLAIGEFARKLHYPQYLTATVGVSENPLDGATADELNGKAEQALLVSHGKPKAGGG